MAVSSSIDFAATRDDIITEALEQLGVLGEGESPSTNQLTSSARTLNMMLKAWQATETNLFAIQKAYVFMQNDQVKYELSSTGDNWSTSIVNDYMAVAGVATDGTITVNDDTGMSASDIIGIELDSGTIQWTTINGAPAANVVTLTVALTGAAATSNRVYTYTTKANRPMKIIEANRIDADSKEEIPIFVRSLRHYTELPNKTTEAPVNTIYFDPQKSTSYLYVWPEPDRVDVFLTLWVQRTLFDLDGAADDVDYPQEWFMAIALSLALLLSPKYGVTGSPFRQLQFLADIYKEQAESWDTEDGFTIEPSTENNREL